MNKYKFILSVFLALFLVSAGYPAVRTMRTTTTWTTDAISPMISSVTYDINRRYSAGDTLQVTMQGEPGGIATFDVETLADGIAMTETSPGVYVGNYTIPQGITSANLQIVGHLAKGNRVDFKIAPYMLSMIPQKEAVVQVIPQNGSYVTTDPPYAKVQFWNQIDAATQENMRAYLDQEDITRFATITSTYLAYSSPKPFGLGKHVIKLESRDNEGGILHQNMGFDISVPSVAQFIPVPSQLLTTVKIFDNASSPAKTGDNVTVTMIGRPNGIATFDVAGGPTTAAVYTPIANFYTPELYSIKTYSNQTTSAQTSTSTPGTSTTTVQTTTTTTTPTYATSSTIVSGAPVPYQITGTDTLGIQMREISPGTYVGQYLVNDADFFNRAVLTGHLTLPDGDQLIGFSPATSDFSYYTAQMINPNQTVTAAATTTTTVQGAPTTTNY